MSQWMGGDWFDVPITRRQMLGGMAIAAGVGLAACTTSSRTESSGSVVTDIALEPPSLNGLDFNYQYLRWIIDQIQEPLYSYDDKLNPVPVLAAELPRVVDELTQEIKLRNGVVFSNGDAFTAEHVAATLNEAGTGNGRVWVSHLTRVKEWQAVDNQTVRVTLKQPDPLLLEKLQNIPILHKNNLPQKDAVMGTGPYQLAEHKSGAYVLLKPNPKYRGSLAKVKELRFRFVPEPGARLVNLVRGDSTIYPTPDFSDIPVLKKDPNITVVETIAPTDIICQPHVGKPPFDDLRVRQALAYSMNRGQVRDVVFSGLADIGQGPLGPAIEGWAQSTKVYSPEPDYEKAKSLLRQAGIPEGKAIDFDFIIVAEPTMINMASVLKQSWAKVGFNANLQIVDLGGWSAKGAAGAFNFRTLYTLDGFVRGKSGDAVTPLLLIGSPANRTKINDPDVSALILKARDSADPQQRAQVWGQFTSLAAERAYWIPPVYGRMIVAHRRELKGLPPAPIQLCRIMLGGVSFG